MLRDLLFGAWMQSRIWGPCKFMMSCTTFIPKQISACQMLMLNRGKPMNSASSAAWTTISSGRHSMGRRSAYAFLRANHLVVFHICRSLSLPLSSHSRLLVQGCFVYRQDWHTHTRHSHVIASPGLSGGDLPGDPQIGLRKCLFHRKGFKIQELV